MTDAFDCDACFGARRYLDRKSDEYVPCAFCAAPSEGVRMTTNQQRAAEVLGFLDLEDANRYARDDTERITAALDEAEQRGRAEVAQQLRDRHARDGYGLCRGCTTYGDDARDILQPVTWPCATRHFLAAEVTP